MKVAKVLGAIVSVAAVSVGSIGFTSTEAKAYTQTQENYLYGVAAALRASGLEYYAINLLNSNRSQSSALNTGYTACEAMDAGVTPERLFNASLNAGDGFAVAAHVLATATSAAVTLCSEYSWMVESSSTQQATYYAPSNAPIGQWATLTAADPDSQINVRSTPSLSASAPHYGVVGDRVWVTRSEYHSGYNWHFVGFSGSGATGWVRGDFVQFE